MIDKRWRLLPLLLTAVALGVLVVSPARDQSSPGFVQGQVPTPGQWNSYFAAKQDYLGFTPGTGTVTSVTCGTALTGGVITTTGTCAVDLASTASVWAATVNKPVDASVLNTSGALTTLTDAATIATDMATGINFTVTLGGNRTLGAPSNTQVGRSGCYFIVQDGTGSRTLAYNSVWKFSNGVAPVLTTTAAAVDMLCYIVRTSSLIVASMSLDVR